MLPRPVPYARSGALAIAAALAAALGVHLPLRAQPPPQPAAPQPTVAAALDEFRAAAARIVNQNEEVRRNIHARCQAYEEAERRARERRAQEASRQPRRGGPYLFEDDPRETARTREEAQARERSRACFPTTEQARLMDVGDKDLKKAYAAKFEPGWRAATQAAALRLESSLQVVRDAPPCRTETRNEFAQLNTGLGSWPEFARLIEAQPATPALAACSQLCQSVARFGVEMCLADALSAPARVAAWRRAADGLGGLQVMAFDPQGCACTRPREAARRIVSGLEQRPEALARGQAQIEQAAREAAANAQAERERTAAAARESAVREQAERERAATAAREAAVREAADRVRAQAERDRTRAASIERARNELAQGDAGLALSLLRDALRERPGERAAVALLPEALRRQTPQDQTALLAAYRAAGEQSGDRLPYLRYLVEIGRWREAYEQTGSAFLDSGAYYHQNDDPRGWGRLEMLELRARALEGMRARGLALELLRTSVPTAADAGAPWQALQALRAEVNERHARDAERLAEGAREAQARRRALADAVRRHIPQELDDPQWLAWQRLPEGDRERAAAAAVESLLAALPGLEPPLDARTIAFIKLRCRLQDKELCLDLAIAAIHSRPRANDESQRARVLAVADAGRTLLYWGCAQGLRLKACSNLRSAAFSTAMYRPATPPASAWHAVGFALDDCIAHGGSSCGWLGGMLSGQLETTRQWPVAANAELALDLLDIACRTTTDAEKVIGLGDYCPLKARVRR